MELLLPQFQNHSALAVAPNDFDPRHRLTPLWGEVSVEESVGVQVGVGGNNNGGRNCKSVGGVPRVALYTVANWTHLVGVCVGCGLLAVVVP